jgi:hypothetical protein
MMSVFIIIIAGIAHLTVGLYEGWSTGVMFILVGLFDIGLYLRASINQGGR